MSSPTFSSSTGLPNVMAFSITRRYDVSVNLMMPSLFARSMFFTHLLACPASSTCPLSPSSSRDLSLHLETSGNHLSRASVLVFNCQNLGIGSVSLDTIQGRLACAQKIAGSQLNLLKKKTEGIMKKTKNQRLLTFLCQKCGCRSFFYPVQMYKQTESCLVHTFTLIVFCLTLSHLAVLPLH